MTKLPIQILKSLLQELLIKNMFFANSKTLKPIIKGKFEYQDFQVVNIYENGIEKEIGIMTKTNNNITCYNFNGTKSVTLSDADYKSIDNYSIKFKSEIAEKFNNLFGFNSDEFPKSFSLGPSMGMAPTGAYYTRFITKIEIGNGYYLESDDYKYKLKSKKTSSFENVKFNGIFIFNYQEQFNYLEFTNSKSEEKMQFFVNHPKINPAILMLPKNELQAFELFS